MIPCAHFPVWSTRLLWVPLGKCYNILHGGYFTKRIKFLTAMCSVSPGSRGAMQSRNLFRKCSDGKRNARFLLLNLRYASFFRPKCGWLLLCLRIGNAWAINPICSIHHDLWKEQSILIPSIEHSPGYLISMYPFIRSYLWSRKPVIAFFFDKY